MPVFAYESYDPRGKKIKKTIEAASQMAAREHLRQQKIFILSLKEKKRMSRFSKELKGTALLVFTTQLAELLKASLPLYESLASLSEEYAHEAYAQVIENLCQKIKGGVPLSQALSAYPALFSSHYIAMIEAGESVGSLDTSLENLAIHLEKGMKLKKMLVTASIYPLILLSFSSIVIIALLSFVVPSLESMLNEQSRGVVTSLVIFLSHLFTRGWKFILPLVGCGGIALYFALKKESFQKKWKEKLLSIPLLNSLLIESALARFFRALGTLLQGGVGLAKGLPLAQKVLKQPVLEEIIMNAEKKILEGARLSRELKKSSLIPPLVTRLIVVGEESGKMQEMLLKLATHYEGEVEKKTARLLAIFQPAMLLVLGVIVGIIMLGVLLPLTDTTSFTGG